MYTLYIIYMYMHMCMYMIVYVYASAYAYVYVYVYIYLYIYVCVYAYVCVSIYIYIYIYIYMYIHLSLSLSVGQNKMFINHCRCLGYTSSRVATSCFPCHSWMMGCLRPTGSSVNVRSFEDWQTYPLVMSK